MTCDTGKESMRIMSQLLDLEYSNREKLLFGATFFGTKAIVGDFR